MNDDLHYIDTTPRPKQFSRLAIELSMLSAALLFLAVVVASIHERWL